MAIDVSFAALQTESARLDDVAEAMTQRIAQARSRVEGLIGSGWSGAAATAFSTEFGDWASAADDAVAALHTLVGGLRAAGQDFVQHEEQVMSTTDSLAAGIQQTGIADIMGGGR
jgi:WXG100 family type VII secretion target